MSGACRICGGPGRFGFGLWPDPTVVWACLAHRAQVDAGYEAPRYQPLPRVPGVTPAPAQPKLL